ncbi:MAG: hypothetical protein ACE5GW_00300 [Planctomycetota bacterium]
MKRSALWKTLPLILSLLLGGALPALGEDPKPTAVVLHHALGKKGEKESIPAKLKPYRKLLLKVGNQFEYGGGQTLQLTVGKSRSAKLPRGLGSASISIDRKGSVQVKLLDPKRKLLGSFRSGRFPLFIVNEKLKAGGAQYVLIIDKKRKR